MLDRVIRRARVGGALVDVGIAAGRIAAIEADIAADAPSLDAEECLLLPGLVETHIHLDKTCIMDRCTIREGTLAEAVRETARAKRGFTAEDVYARGRRTLERCIAHGTQHMRTHVEVDPGIGMVGFEGVSALARDHAWALDMQICVFPQEGLLNNPGTERLLVEGLRRGATVLGAAPYTDSDPAGQIDRIFALAREHDVDIDMHLDLAETVEGMQAEHVCRRTEEYGWGGRVTVGHATQMSLLPPERFAQVARRLADAGVAVTVLPSTDLFLMGRATDHAKPRGVVPASELLSHGVNCSVATNNVLNPFTPYGDGSLVRMANLYANVCHAAGTHDLSECLAMVTDRAAHMLRLREYGIAVGNPANLLLLDAATPDGAVAELARPLWALRRGEPILTWDRPVLHRPTTEREAGQEGRRG